jgi:hypothetical protein
LFILNGQSVSADINLQTKIDRYKILQNELLAALYAWANMPNINQTINPVFVAIIQFLSKAIEIVQTTH